MDLVQSSLKVFISNTIGAIISFFAVTVFSREIGASPLGTYYSFIALLGILAIPSDFGVRSATEKRMSEGVEMENFLGTAIVLKIPPLVLVSIIILIFDPVIEQYLGADLAVPLVIALFAREGGNFSIGVLRGELRVGETALIKILRPLGWLVVGYLLFVRGYGVLGLVYGYIAGSTAMILAGWWKVSTQPSKPSLRHARSLFDYGRYSVVSSVGGYFYSWMDVAILTAFVAAGVAGTRADIGAYENAWRVSLLVMMFSKAIATTIFPQMSRWDAENTTERIENIIPTAILPALLLVIPAFAGSVVLAKDILRVLFTPEFAIAWLALIVLMAEKILQAVHVVLGRSLQAIDRPDLAAYATVVAVVINFVLNVVLIWQYGIVGAAIATTVSFAVNTLLHTYYLSQFITINFPVREAGWCIFAATVMAISVYFVQLNMSIHTIIDLSVIISLGAAVYGILIVSFGPIRSRIWALVGPTISKRIP